MTQSVRCRCRGNPGCQLCHGTKFYDYEVGPRGWMPFRCPTCGGAGTVPGDGGGPRACFTCRGSGNVDPADPPAPEGAAGFFRNAWKIFFGG